MKKEKFFYILVLFSSTLFGQINDYDMEAVYTFLPNTNPKGFEPYQDTHDMNPSSFYFDDDGNMFLADSIYRRILKYDKDFKLLDQYKKMRSSRFDRLYIKNNLILASGYKEFLIETITGETIFHLPVSKLERALTFENFNKYFIYEDGVITISTTKGVMYNINNPSSKSTENILINISDKETKNVTKKSLNKKESEYSNFSSFVKFKDKIKNKNTRIAPDKANDFEKITIRSEQTMQFINSDRDGNIYWNDSYRNIIIFNSDFEFIDAFGFDVPNSQIDPVVHPNGDVYFMDITNERAQLLRVRRVW